MARQREDANIKADEPTIGLEPSGTEPQTTSLRGQPAEKVGGTIGPYKLLDELGEGGMGTVYLAEQDRPVRRRVALKIIKPGLDTAQVIARFEAERQALALMDHSNIARVLDAGTTASGRPYFVMEWVQGVPITSYCDQHRLTLRERLELFLPICRAVQHAHQKGIIHRDLKPSNILVTLRDDQPVPKIIDFGIAKATTQRLTERTLYTQYGQLVGTPDYMSPEQAGMGGIDVDTRSDVYSLGAVLYELLCGDTPLGQQRLRQLDFVAMLNVIYEQEPLSPSRRIAELGDQAAEIARRRNTEPPKLAHALRGELDWIATKALEKERIRRYESPSALAADIERHLNNQPVEASPPSAVYRVRKFIRRNRAGLAAAATIASVLIGGIVVSGWQAYRATQAEHDMAIEREAALEAKGLAEARRRDAENAKQLADAQRKLAEEAGGKLAAALAKAENAADKERDARAEIEQRLREADAMRLAMNAKDSLERFPQRALLLAAEAVETTRRKNEPIRSAAHQALREALDNIGGRPVPAHHDAISFLQLAPNRRWLFTSDGQMVRRWDLSHDDPPQTSVVIGSPGFFHRAAGLSRNGRWLATITQSSTARKVNLWDLESNEFDEPTRQFDVPAQQINYTLGQAVFNADATWLAVAAGPTAWLWDLAGDAAKPVVLSAKSSPFNEIVIGANGRWAVTRDYNGAPALWSLSQSGSDPTPRQLSDSNAAFLRDAEVSPDGRWLVASDRPGGTEFGTRIWDLTAEDPARTARTLPLSDRVRYARHLFCFLPDGRWLAVAAGDSLTVWGLDLKPFTTPRYELSLSEPPLNEQDGLRVGADVQALLSTADSRWLLAIDGNGVIRRWNFQAEDPNATRSIIGQHPGGGVQLNVSASGRWLVSSRSGESPRLWDLERRNPQTAGLELRGHDLGSYSTVRTAVGGGKITALATAGEPVRLTFLGFGIVRDSLGLGEKWLATSGADGTLRLWDLSVSDPARAGLRVGRVKLDGRDVAIRDDGEWVVLGRASNIQLVKAPEFDQRLASVDLHRSFPWINWSSSDRPLSRDGRWMSVRVGDRIHVYDLQSADLLATPTTSPRAAKPPLSPGNENVVWDPAVDAGRWLQAFLNPGLPNAVPDPTAPRPHKVVENPPDRRFNEVIISPNGQWLLSRTDNVVQRPGGTTHFSTNHWWLHHVQADDPSASGTDLGEFQHPPTFSPNGQWLAGCKTEQSKTSLLLWRLQPQLAEVAKVDLRHNAYLNDKALAFSADGRWLACAAGSVQVFPIVSDSELGEPQTLVESAGHRNVALSPDGRFVAASNGQAVDLWDRTVQDSPGQLVLRGHEQSVGSLAFSPDGVWLVTAGQGGEICLWDLRDESLQDTRIELNVEARPGYHVDISNLLFSPDGRWLAASTWSGVYVWHLDPAGLLHEARRLAGRELSDNELAQFRLNTPDHLRDRLLRQAAEVSLQLEKNPEDVALFRRRTELYAAAGDFAAALDDLRLLTRLRPDDHWHYYCLLSLLAKTEQREEYRRVGRAMMERFRDPPPSNLEILERTAKGCLFWADSGFDWKEIAPLADEALQKATETKHWVLPWAQVAKGLAECRLGNYREALEWADKALEPANASVYSIAVPANFVKAIAHAQLNDLNKAQAALAAARKAQAAVPAPPQTWSGWNDWYMCDIMLREAEAVLLEKAPPETVSAINSGASADQ